MKNYGFIEPEITETDYIFGGQTKLQGESLTDGHWLKYIPESELQKNDWIDSYNCTAFGTSNILEVLFTKVFNETKNFSDRFIGIIAGTQPPGNSPKVVIDAIRKQGLVNESSLPFSDAVKTIQEYFSPKPPTGELISEGNRFLIEHGIGYEKVEPTIENLKSALRFSPLGVAVKAWYGKDGLYYFPEGEYNHWTCLIDYVDGKYWIVFDSYYPHIKHIGWNEKFGYTLRYWLGAGLKEQLTIMQKIVEIMIKLATLLGFPPDKEPVIVPDSQPEIPPPAQPKPIIPKYEWDTYEKARHSARVIMDEHSVAWKDKDLLCAVIMAESHFDPNAVNHNRNAKGEITSTDFGICQINNYYWIGQGKYFASKEEVLKFPEKSVVFMIQRFKEGKLNLWSAFVNQSYKRYL